MHAFTHAWVFGKGVGGVTGTQCCSDILSLHNQLCVHVCVSLCVCVCVFEGGMHRVVNWVTYDFLFFPVNFALRLSSVQEPAFKHEPGTVVLCCCYLFSPLKWGTTDAEISVLCSESGGST